MKSNSRENRILVILVILLAFLFILLFLPNASLSDKNSASTNFVHTGGNWYDVMEQSSYFNSSKLYQDPDISLNDNSVYSTKINELSGYFPKGWKDFPNFTVHERFYKTSPINFNSFPVSSGFSWQKTMDGSSESQDIYSPSLTPSLFSRRDTKSMLSSQKGLFKIEYDSHTLDQNFANKPNLLYENYYDAPNDIDPGGPPDGEPIPVPDGFYFLLFLGAIYACKKMNMFHFFWK